jgi:hypothetical protein
MKRFPFYPLLLAVFPVLALLANNIAQVQAWAAVRPMIISLVGGALLFALSWLALRSWSRAALLTTLLLAWFFSYGHIYNLLKPLTLLGLAIGRHRLLFPLFTLLFAGLAWLVLRSRSDFTSLVLPLNIIASLLVAFQIINIAGYTIRFNAAAANPPVADLADGDQLKPADPNQMPDIYYIILDAYTRQDALQTYFDFNNQPFVDGLKKLGFYVADCSRANYTSTELSLSSSLNMNYLPALSRKFAEGSADRSALPELMKHSQLRQQLEAIGYHSVSFQEEYYWVVWDDADILMTATSSGQALRSIRPFEAMLLRDTAVSFLVDAGSVLAKGWVEQVNFPYADHINQVLFMLDKLDNMASLSGPKLVFAHVLVPHLPFVFNADGSIQQDENYYRDSSNPINDDYYKKGYTSQIQFINGRILPILQRIINESKVPPVIILQGDHGVKDFNRGAILNAYFLPGAAGRLYPSITPVNTFRLVLDQYFGAHYDLLPDLSYTTPLDEFRFTPLEEVSPVCQK